MPTEKSDSIIEKRVVKRGNEWCVVHGADGDEGKIIKCYTGKGAEEKAKKLHRAIMASKFKEFSNNALLKYTKYSMVFQTDDKIIKCFKEIATRKENKELIWNLNIKELAEPIRDRWNRIKVELNNQEIASIVLKSNDYEKLKNYLTFNYKIKELPVRLKSLILRIHNMSDEKLLELRKRLDE